MTLTVLRIRIKKAVHRMAFSGDRGSRLCGWIARDRCLMDQWDAAYRDRDFKEMERLRSLMNQNWMDYRCHSTP